MRHQPTFGPNYLPRSKDERKLTAARVRLVRSGLAEAVLKTFPPDQVILLDEARELHGSI